VLNPKSNQRGWGSSGEDENPSDGLLWWSATHKFCKIKLDFGMVSEVWTINWLVLPCIYLPPIPNLMNGDHGVAHCPPAGAIILCGMSHSKPQFRGKSFATLSKNWHNSTGSALYAEECIGSQV
jgi:hypothetical protein